MKIKIRCSTPARAFTLVELLLVLVILGILAAIVIPKFSGRTEQARRLFSGERGAARMDGPGRRHGKADEEAIALAGSAFARNLPAMALNDRIGDGKSKAGAGARFEGKERIEKVAVAFLGNGRAILVHFEQEAVGFPLEDEFDGRERAQGGG